MQGVVLAGGTGSRLFPLSKVISKHLLPVGKYPMVYHPIMTLTRAGITDILVVTSPESMGHLSAQLGSGHELGANFTYLVQDQPGGIAQALGLVKPHIRTQQFAVVLGDNIFEPSICETLVEVTKFYDYDKYKPQARVFLKEVRDPHRFGVAELVPGTHIVKAIEEKPGYPKSNYAVTGLYIYDQHVFDAIGTLKPSKRGELEITDVNNWYISKGSLSCSFIEGFWSDAGTHESYKHANQHVWTSHDWD